MQKQLFRSLSNSTGGQTILLLEALRDFFYYGSKSKLKQAYATLLAVGETDRNLENIDWEQEEFTFNRLFVGPTSPLAPAVASVYLEPDGVIQGKVTAEIRMFYDSIGLRLAELGSEPEDSLAYELDACRHLLLLGEKVPMASEAYSSFVKQHVAAWVPGFTSRALAHCGDSVAVRDVLVLLSEWVRKENRKITHQKEME